MARIIDAGGDSVSSEAVTRREDVGRFLPTLKRARAEGLLLPPGTPAERRQLSALVVKVRMVRREAWREQVSVGQRALQRMPKQAPRQVLAVDTTTQAIHRVVCYIPCSSCSTRFHGSRLQVPGCSQCSAFVELDHFRDRRFSMAETYVPREVTSVPAMFSFESALEEMIPVRPPEVLRCMDLRPRIEGSAYRSSGQSKQPTFFGYRFGDSIDEAKEAIDRFMLRGPIVAYDIRAWAWPFVWLRWGIEGQWEERALFCDGRGKLHSFLGSAPDLPQP
ncbi:MAG: hypothetical protein JRI23_01010 [Deltaproteobacteria bacterium]|jgi:hypothetical protein|nr:hypothetical protein [Deltaproteobacteria bacterium]MBW2530033.1 hypothetical protein [Deltaproteobacteria bacterium]